MISISRALVELKTLDSRIDKTIRQNQFMICKTKQQNSHIVEADYKKAVTANFQSIQDMIVRRSAIKNAIVKSNTVTEVEIHGKKMIVAEAIEYKNAIKYKQLLLDTLKAQRQAAIVQHDSHKSKVQAKIDANVQIICGKEKHDPAAVQSISEAMIKADPIEMFDPLKIDAVIDSLTEEISAFLSNVDYALSESNALTKIDVSEIN